MLFASAPSFYPTLPGCLSKPHPCSPCGISFEIQKGGRISDYPVKGKGCGDFFLFCFVGSAGAPVVFRNPPARPLPHSPLKGLLGTVNTVRSWVLAFQEFWLGRRVQHPNIWKALGVLLPEVETLGPNDARETACVCVFRPGCVHFAMKRPNYFVVC